MWSFGVIERYKLVFAREFIDGRSKNLSRTGYGDIKQEIKSRRGRGLTGSLFISEKNSFQVARTWNRPLCFQSLSRFRSKTRSLTLDTWFNSIDSSFECAFIQLFNDSLLKRPLFTIWIDMTYIFLTRTRGQIQRHASSNRLPESLHVSAQEISFISKIRCTNVRMRAILSFEDPEKTMTDRKSVV
jgi:hypothetical protein